MRCSRLRLVAVVASARTLAGGGAVVLIFFVAGCSSSTPSRAPATFAPFPQPSAPSGAPSTLTRTMVAGHWEITAFQRSGKIMDTCLGEDASIDFALDGTWLAHNRQDGHTYGGAYSFSGVDGLALTAGQYQQYSVTMAGDAMTLLGGRTLRITLQRGAAPATPETVGTLVPAAR